MASVSGGNALTPELKTTWRRDGAKKDIMQDRSL